jgi:hypothetical protein
MPTRNKFEFPLTEPINFSEYYPPVDLGFFHQTFEFYRSNVDDDGRYYSEYLDEIIDDNGKTIKKGGIDFFYDENNLLKSQSYNSSEIYKDEKVTKIDYEIYGNKVVMKIVENYVERDLSSDYVIEKNFLKSVCEISKDEYLQIFDNSNKILFCDEVISPNLQFSDKENSEIVNRYTKHFVHGDVEFIETTEIKYNDYFMDIYGPIRVIENKIFQQFKDLYLLISYEFFYYKDEQIMIENKKIILGYDVYKPFLNYIETEDQQLIYTKINSEFNKYEKWILVNKIDNSLEDFYTHSLEKL